MKLQSRFPYDSTLLGLEGKYQPLGDDGFLINSNCIIVKDHIVITGQTYFLFERSESKKIKGTAVKLVDCFYHHDMIYILVAELFSGQVMLRNHALENELTICQWRLVDTDSIEEMTDRKYGR